ncbi:MAG: peptidase [Bacteroidia bacterium]|nr:peptidase [Bacteroidia bacterium]
MNWNRKKIQRWLRILHRDIGYFAVGITLVYALSGFFLSHKNIFPATKTVKYEIELPKNLNGRKIEFYWNANTSVKLNHYKESENGIRLFVEGGNGYYDKTSGKTSYEIYKKHPIISFLNQLHSNQKEGWIHIADSYVFVLVFLSISGLFMVNGKNSFLKRGVWLMILGIILVLLFIYVN